MKKLWKCSFLGLFLLVLLNGVGFTAGNIKEADKLFDKGTFQEALKEYELIFKETKNVEIRWKAFFRACESLTHLFRYGAAAQKLISIPLPKQTDYRVRVLILKAELFRNFLSQYSSIQRGDIIDEEKNDVFRLTPEEIKEEIKKAYRQLWELRKELVKLDIKKEGYFLEIKDIDLGMYPTLFDYFILSWTDYLLSVEGPGYMGGTQESIRPEAKLLLVDKFKRKIKFSDSPALLAAELMESAGIFALQGRMQAGEHWKIKRILLPLTYNNLFDLRNLAKDKKLYDNEDVKIYRKQAKEILLRWMENFKTKEAKAEAGYQAAKILNDGAHYLPAVKLCERIEEEFSHTYASRKAESLRARIQMPTLNLQVKTVMPPAKEVFTVTTRNLEKIYFRVYKIDPYGLKNEDSFFRKNFNGWSNLLNYPNRKWLKEHFLPEVSPYKEWKIAGNKKEDFNSFTQVVDPPALTAGIYLVLACGDKSFKVGSSLLQACFFNVTNLVLVGTPGFSTEAEDAYYRYMDDHGREEIVDEGFRFYALEAKTGKPADSANLDIYTYTSFRGERRIFKLTTDKTGRAALSLPVRVAPDNYNYYHIDPLAKRGKSFSFWRNNQYLNYHSPEPIVLFIETDRPIYRPGDKVRAKVIVVRRKSEGFKTLDKTAEVTFSVSDPNGKKFFTKKVNLKEFGSADISFRIPTGRLLGRYNINVQGTDGRFSNNKTIGFSVEEYKRPEFEVVLKEAKEAWKYNQPVKIYGRATYYFGGPVPNASIKYRIKRQVYIPWYYRYWFRGNYSANEEEIAGGELKTDEQGNFIIDFIPMPPPQTKYAGSLPDISRFLVEVEGRDSGGRTISAQQSYQAGKNAIYLVLEPKKGFYLTKESVSIQSKRLTINDAPVEGKSSYKVFQLQNVPVKTLLELGYSYAGNFGDWLPPLDVQLKDVPNGELVALGKIRHNKKGEALIKINPLLPGTYRLEEESFDRWGGKIKQSKIFVVAKNRKEAVPVNAPSVMLVEKDEYKVGETARFIIGSGLAGGIYHLELWAGTHFLKQILIDGNQPVRLIQIPVTEKMKGGFTLRWFGVKNLEVHYGQTTVAVPWKEKKLKLALTPFNKTLKPGEKVTWGVKISDWKKQPVKGEVLALMYDRSLEYYLTSNNLWLSWLYNLRPAPAYGVNSVFNPYSISLPITEGLLQKLLKAFRQPPRKPALPRLRTARTWARVFGYRGRSEMLGEICDTEVCSGESEVMPQAATLKKSIKIENKAGFGAGGKKHRAAAEVKTRKEFADTAFFKPHIVTGSNGTKKFTFTVPEQLTSWKVKLFAFTKDVKEGILTEEAVTKKELMVRADLPRFFREKDKGTVSAIVHNESEEMMQGELVIEISENNKLINQKLKLKDNKKPFEIEPHSLAAFNWTVEIPEGITTYKVRVVAMTDKFSDAEERELPILPSRQRLIESAFTTLSGNETKKLEIVLKADSTRINESMVLQVDPQLALSILNTMPFLVQYPYNCVEQILNKYVPLSIVNEIYKKYPALRKAVSKIPRRKTVTPAWEKDDPRRLLSLMETPWLWQSEGRPACSPTIDLLDPGVVQRQKERNLAKLKAAQLSNGAFPWWPGGKEDAYMTLYILAGFAEARRYGVKVPKDMIQKALRYVNKEIPLKLKAEERYLSLVAYAAYVVTSYPVGEFSAAGEGHQAAKSWVVFLERHIHALTPLGEAYLSYTYLRLGNKKRAEEILDMAMDGVREDPIAGAYWTPEKYSWVWYSDTVEKHAFFLRTLQEIRPQDKLIPGMVQWLLFNRKGTVWKSTKASVAAVYALLDYLNQRGALAADELFQIKWGKMTDSVVVKADDWLEEPLRWQEKGFKITPEKQKVAIKKEGPGLAFASLTWIYSTDQIPEASTPGMLELKRKFYRRVKEGKRYHLKPIKSGTKVRVGEQIEVQLKINTRSQFEYMHLKDPKAAGFEAETLLSGWKYDLLRFYEEPRDSLTNFFMSRIPHGEYILRYRLKPTKPGIYRMGAATLQSMYSPEMTAHSAGFIIEVVE